MFVPGEKITRLLQESATGNREALDSLIPMIYDELRRLAGDKMLDERSDHTMQATALIHEAYVRLMDQEQLDWNDHSEVLAAAANVMRRVLVDHARMRTAAKRGGNNHKVESQEPVAVDKPDADLIALDDALAALDAKDPRMARIVELKFFGRMTKEEIAAAVGVSVRQVGRDWTLAKSLLHHFMRPQEPVDG